MEEFKQYELPETPKSPSIVETPDGAVLNTGQFKSPNYVKGQSGWKLQSEGGAEFSGGLSMGQSFLLGRRSGIANNSDDVFEIFPQLAAPSGANNYIFVGRKGSSATSDTYRVILSATNRLEFEVNGSQILLIDSTGLTINGIAALAGTKVYYVADTSGGAVTRKLTFTDGILTSET